MRDVPNSFSIPRISERIAESFMQKLKRIPEEDTMF